MVMFGGFQDNSAKLRFFNDTWLLDLESGLWTRLAPLGEMPRARSAAHVAVRESTLYVYGGYTKEKSYGEFKGIVLDDMWAIDLAQPAWRRIKAAGPVRAGMASCCDANRLFLFGGTTDTDTVDDLASRFHSDLWVFLLDKETWFRYEVRANTPETIYDTGVTPRMNASLAVHNNALYLYGGVAEQGDAEVVFNDLYVLHLNKPEGFVQLVESDQTITVEPVNESDSEDEDELEQLDSKEIKLRLTETKDVLDQLSAKLRELEIIEQPLPNAGETIEQFYDRTKEFWLEHARSITSDEKAIRRTASMKCADRYESVRPLVNGIAETTSAREALKKKMLVFTAAKPKASK
jgi:hypothetical protein